MIATQSRLYRELSCIVVGREPVVAVNQEDVERLVVLPCPNLRACYMSAVQLSDFLVFLEQNCTNWKQKYKNQRNVRVLFFSSSCGSSDSRAVE